MSEHLWNTGIVLILAGILVTFVAIILSFTTFKGKSKVKGGGAIIIGPFPIIFGTSKESVKILLLFYIILIVSLLVFMAFSHFTLK